MITVDTEGFWDMMCHPRFARKSDHTGMIGDTIYFTLEPPEKVAGFIEARIAHIREAQGVDEDHSIRGKIMRYLFNGMVKQ